MVNKNKQDGDELTPRPYDRPDDECDSADDAELPLQCDRSRLLPPDPDPALHAAHRGYLDGRHLKKGWISCHKFKTHKPFTAFTTEMG